MKLFCFSASFSHTIDSSSTLKELIQKTNFLTSFLHIIEKPLITTKIMRIPYSFGRNSNVYGEDVSIAFGLEFQQMYEIIRMTDQNQNQNSNTL